MEKEQIIAQIREFISPLLDSQGVELVDIELKGSIGNQLLRIFVDIEGGITLDHCVDLSREISDILDIKDIIPGRYRLEVSSPGADRPLKTVNDFRRNIGRTVKIKLVEGNTIEGDIEKVDESIIYLRAKNGLHQIPLSAIKKAKVVFQW